MVNYFKVDTVTYKLTCTLDTKNGISSRIYCNQYISWSNAVLRNSIRKVKQWWNVSKPLLGKKKNVNSIAFNH